MFDRLVVTAYETLHKALVWDELATEEVPSPLFTRIQTELNAKKNQVIHGMETSLATVALSSLSKNRILENAPTLNEIMNPGVEIDNRALWKPVLR